MGRVKDFFNNMNRSVLLAIGLIVIAVLIAATFALGDTDEVAEESNGGDATQQEQQEGGTNGTGENGGQEGAGGEEANDGEETAVNPTGDGSNGGTNGEEGTQDGEVAQTGGNSEGESMPSQLADTGPVTSAAAALLLGAGGYLYHRSRNDLEERRKE